MIEGRKGRRRKMVEDGKERRIDGKEKERDIGKRRGRKEEYWKD